MLHVESLDFPGRLPGFLLWVLGSEAEHFSEQGVGPA